jgi:cysteine desulfurase
MQRLVVLGGLSDADNRRSPRYHGIMPDTPLERIYLDHNATTPVFPEVADAMRACWSEPYLNPASQHEFGRRARRILEDARDRIAGLIGANTSGVSSDRVIFTSGGTEANNLALRGLLPPPPGEGRGEGALVPHLIISAIEHPSITRLAEHFLHIGWQVDRLGVDGNGVIRVDDLPRMLRPETRLVAAMVANNETGVVQPVAKLAAICNDRGIPLHSDAAQAAGKLPLNFQAIGVATMSVAAHKFGGPIGIGALIVRSGAPLSPLLYGGVQQYGLRPGTESVALALGLQTALELWHKNRREWLSRLEAIRTRFEAALGCNNSSGSHPPNDARPVVLGKGAERLPNTSNIAFVGLDRQQLFLALDQAGIACSTGSACASGSSEPSPVHIAMGCDPGVISSALRFSFGVQTTAEEAEQGAARIVQACNDLRRRKEA